MSCQHNNLSRFASCSPSVDHFYPNMYSQRMDFQRINTPDPERNINFVFLIPVRYRHHRHRSPRCVVVVHPDPDQEGCNGFFLMCTMCTCLTAPHAIIFTDVRAMNNIRNKSSEFSSTARRRAEFDPPAFRFHRSYVIANLGKPSSNMLNAFEPSCASWQVTYASSSSPEEPPWAPKISHEGFINKRSHPTVGDGGKLQQPLPSPSTILHCVL